MNSHVHDGTRGAVSPQPGEIVAYEEFAHLLVVGVFHRHAPDREAVPFGHIPHLWGVVVSHEERRL
jgi:hypothetical protein